MKHCLACGLNCYTSCSSRRQQQQQQPDNSPDIHTLRRLCLHCCYTPPPRDPLILSIFYSLRTYPPDPAVSFVPGTCFSCSFPAMALNLEKALQNVRTSFIVECLHVWQLLTLPSMARTITIRFVRTPELPRCCVEIRSSIQSATSATLMDAYIVRPCQDSDVVLQSKSLQDQISTN